MIVVRIELHSARTGRVTELGRMNIANDGTSSDPGRGNYNVELMRRGTTNVVQRRAVVPNHPRRSATVWVLLAKAMRALGNIRGFGTEHGCDQCETATTAERCPQCKLWTCDSCFDTDHIFCRGLKDGALGLFRGLAEVRSAECAAEGEYAASGLRSPPKTE